jgi:hypothetical protein
MNRRFKKPIALFTSLVALSATALVMFTVPASASPNPCQDGCNLGAVTNTVNTPPGSTNYTPSNYELGLAFHVTAPGTVNAISFYLPTGEEGLTVPVSLTDETTSTVLCNQCVSVPPQSSPGFYAAFLGPIPVVPGQEYVASYSSVAALGYNSRTLPTAVDGTLVGDCGTYSGGAGTHTFQACPSNSQDYGVNVQFFQTPNPVMTATRVDSTHASLTFGDSGDAGTTYSISCTAPGAPTVIVAPPTVGLTSPQTVTLIPGIVYTCTTTATSIGGTGTGSVTISVLTTSGPGCMPSGTVAAPGQISAASQAFPGAEVSWAPVATDCLSGYLITPSTGSAVFVAGHGTTTLVKGPFAFGSTVGFTVAAVTGAGVGPQSAGVSVTIGTPATVTHLKATTAGKGAIKVSFKAGASNGAAIKSFTATCGSKSASGKASPLTVKGLTPGKSYTCSVTATNSRGKGALARSSATKA